MLIKKLIPVCPIELHACIHIFLKEMEKHLTQDFVERKIHPLTILPVDWGLETRGTYYELDLKMCQLRHLEYSFQWGDERFVSEEYNSIYFYDHILYHSCLSSVIFFIVSISSCIINKRIKL